MSAKGRYDSERLHGRPIPLKLIGKGQSVEVFMGAGWAKGTVSDSNPDRCVVWLAQAQRSITVYDNRNLRRSSQ